MPPSLAPVRWSGKWKHNLTAVRLIILIFFFSFSFLCSAQKDSTNITGTWIEKLSKANYQFTFGTDGYAYYIVSGDTIGGSPARNPHTRIFLRFTTGRNSKFLTVDLIKGRLSNGREVEQSRLKGIYTYLPDGRLKMCLNFAPADARPDEFVRENTFILTKKE